MAIQSLLGQITDEKLLELPSRQRNAAKVQQHLNAFALHLQGLSDRAVQEELGVKTLSSAQHSIKRGEEISKKLGLDSERIRLKVAAWFEELTDLTMRQVRDQVAGGTLVEMVDGEGNRSYRRTKHADPRMVAEASRGLVRTAQFFGLMDADSSTSSNDISTNVVFISPTSDGASWDEQLQTVDVTAMSTQSSAGQQNSLGMGEATSLKTEAPSKEAR